MIRFVLLLLRLRWQLAKGAFRAASAKGGLAALGAVVAVVAPFIAALFLLVGAVALAGLAWKGGVALGAGPDGDRGLALLIMRLSLGLGTGMLLIEPAIRASRGASGDAQSALTRLLLLPVSRRHLHVSEVASSAMDPIVLLFAPALIALGLSVARSSSVAAGVVTLLAGLLLIVGFVTLAAALSFGLQLVLRNRQRAESLLLATMVALISFALLPGLLERLEDRRKALAPGRSAAAEEVEPMAPPPPMPSDEEQAAAHAKRRAENEQRRVQRAETFPVWLQWLPSEAHGRAVATATGGRPVAALPWLAWIGAFAAGAWWLSRVLWERLVSSPESSGGGGHVDPASVRLRELPLVAPATSVVALTTARTFFRTVRGKLAIALTPLTVGFLGFMLSEGSKVVTETGVLLSVRGRLGWFAIFMSLLSLLPVSANAFASDRAGLTLQALAPIGVRRLVWGKALGGLLIYLPCLLLCLLAASFVGAGFAPSFWLRTLASGLAALAFLTPLATWMSILLPKHADLGTLNQAGNPHQGAQWVVILGTGVVMALVGLADVGGQFVTGSPWGGVAGCLLLAALGLVAAWPLLDAASEALEKRREVVLSTAEGR